MSHELRTPLMALSTSLELLEGKVKDVPSRGKIESMQNTIKNMNDLINELLFLARKTDQKFLEKIRIGKYLSNYIQEQFMSISEEKNIQLICKISKDFTIATQPIFLQKVF